MRAIIFPEYSGLRCLMMPYRQGDPSSIPSEYSAYTEIVGSVFHKEGEIGFLTIDESPVLAGQSHRGERARHGRALHTEAGIIPGDIYCWGSTGWGEPTYTPPPKKKETPKDKPTQTPKPKSHRVTLDRGVRILLASNTDNTCAVWDAEHKDTSEDGDIGHMAHLYPYADAIVLKAGELRDIGILTPHESLPVERDQNRQFLRIISSGVHGREPYFTPNPKCSASPN